MLFVYGRLDPAELRQYDDNFEAWAFAQYLRSRWINETKDTTTTTLQVTLSDIARDTHLPRHKILQFINMVPRTVAHIKQNGNNFDIRFIGVIWAIDGTPEVINS